MQSRDAVRACVLREVVCLSSCTIAAAQQPQQPCSVAVSPDTVDFLTHIDTRELVYGICIELACDDALQRRQRHAVGVFLVLHVPSFPPSRAQLCALDCCAATCAAEAADVDAQATFATLRRLLAVHAADAAVAVAAAGAAGQPPSRMHLTRRCRLPYACNEADVGVTAAVASRVMYNNSDSGNGAVTLRCAHATRHKTSADGTPAVTATSSSPLLRQQSSQQQQRVQGNKCMMLCSGTCEGAHGGVACACCDDDMVCVRYLDDTADDNNNNATTAVAAMARPSCAPSSLIVYAATAATPRGCTPCTLEQHLRVLLQFREGYTRSPVVAQSTGFFVTHWCAAYAGKLLYGAPYTLLRGVSVSYLHLLLECATSEYLCVRNHVYDMLYTLAAHVQLLEPPQQLQLWQTTTMTMSATARVASSTVSDSATAAAPAAISATAAAAAAACSYGSALQDELSWLLLCVLRRQALTPSTDTSTWAVAAKCALALLPRHTLRRVDVRALRQMLLRVPSLAEMHSAAYDVLVAAFADGLCVDAHDKDVTCHCGNTRYALIDQAAVATLCGSATAAAADVTALALALYRRTPTGSSSRSRSSNGGGDACARGRCSDGNCKDEDSRCEGDEVAMSRVSLFRLLFAIAVWRCRDDSDVYSSATSTTAATAMPSSSSLTLSRACVYTACYDACVQLQLHARLYALLFYASRPMRQTLTTQLLHTATTLLLTRHRVVCDVEQGDSHTCYAVTSGGGGRAGVCGRHSGSAVATAMALLSRFVTVLVATLLDDVTAARRVCRGVTAMDDTDGTDGTATVTLARLLRTPAVHAALHVAPRVLGVAADGSSGGGVDDGADGGLSSVAVTGTLPQLSAHRVAWLLVVRGLLACCAHDDADVRRGALSAIAHALTTACGNGRGGAGGDARAHRRMRRVCVEVLCTLAVLCTHVHDATAADDGGNGEYAVEAFVVMLEHVLFALHMRSTADRDALLQLCNSLLELLSQPTTTTTTTAPRRLAATTAAAEADTAATAAAAATTHTMQRAAKTATATTACDIATLLLTGRRALRLCALRRLVRVRAMWCIYRALCACSCCCGSNDARGQMLPVRRLRHVLVLVLLSQLSSRHAPSPVPHAAMQLAWASVQCADDYRPIVRIAATAAQQQQQQRLDGDDTAACVACSGS